MDDDDEGELAQRPKPPPPPPPPSPGTPLTVQSVISGNIVTWSLQVGGAIINSFNTTDQLSEVDAVRRLLAWPQGQFGTWG